MKKKIAMFLAVVLALSALTTGALAAETPALTRGEFALFLWETHYRLGAAPAQYTDVQADTDMASAVSLTSEMGLMKGYGDGSFGVDDPMTREQLAVVLYRNAAGYGLGFTGSWMFQLDYPDAGQVSDWAYEALCWMTMKGLYPVKDGKLLPGASVGYDEALRFANATFAYILEEKENVEAVDWSKIEAEEYWFNACYFASLMGEDDILPLVTLTADDENVIWDEDGERVLLFNFHQYPDSYPEGETITLSWGHTWTCSVGELLNWMEENGEGVENWADRLDQLMGTTTGRHTHITAMWVDVDDVMRPAYVSDPTKQMQADFDKATLADTDFVTWFEGNVRSSYFTGRYPWTRLGYTFDWLTGGYGLTEFLIRKGSTVEVAFTLSVEEIMSWEPDVAALSANG